MTRDFSIDTEPIVNTLLQVGETVLEVSDDLVITHVWNDYESSRIVDNKDVGKKVTEAFNSTIASNLEAAIFAVFETRTRRELEYNTINNENLAGYYLRILPVHPAKHSLFVIVERLSKPKITGPAEDDWLKILDSTSDGVWDINLENSTIRFSEKWQRTFGYDAAEIKTISEWTSKLHPEDLDRSKKKIEEYLAGSAPFYSTELRLMDKHGNYKWVASKGIFTCKESNGKPLRFIGTHTDIDKVKVVEQRADEQRNFYEHILNSIPADIAIFGADYKYLFVNQNAFKNEELRKWMIGKTDIDYARYSNRPDSFFENRFAQLDRAMLEKKEAEAIEKLVDKNGKTGYHLRLLRPVYDETGAFEFVMAYGVNITDLILVQEELKTSVETFASAFDYSGIGMALVSPEGKWLDVNKVLCQLIGYSKEELLERTYEDITYPEDLESGRSIVVQMLKKEITTCNLERRFISKDKKIVLVSLTASLVWNNDNTPKFFIVQLVDITKKKELENDLNRKNAELETAKASLINKINQLEQLTHIIAHNLRGPAGNIRMLSDELISMNNAGEESVDESAFTQNEVLGLINESSVQLMTSLATLMEISKIKLDQEVPYDDCNVKTIINDIASQLQSIIFEKQAIIKNHLFINKISYPHAYLESILYNLVSNALKYSRPGIPPEITITTRQHDERVQIVVKDNGLGIDMEKYGDKIFRLNQVFHEGFDSKGVGLYIIKTQVESFGGNIEVVSKPNEGCEFIVTL